MKPHFTVAALFVAICCAEGAYAQPTPATSSGYIIEQPATPPRVGQIFIVGNDVTVDSVILKTIGIHPGQPLRDADLKAAENKLKRLGIFDTKSPPTVEALPSQDGADAVDILVRIKETQTGSFSISAGLETSGRIVLYFELRERNLDPWKLPTSLADIRAGRAFRGAGNTFRLKLTLR